MTTDAGLHIILDLSKAGKVPEAVREFITKVESKVLDSNQREMLRFIREQVERGERQIVIKAARQIGKSFFLVALAIIIALLVPGAQIKYACPSGKMAKQIIRPHFRQLVSELPSNLWEFANQQGEYTFYPGSAREATITIGGCDAGNIESLRGQHAHIVIVDEAGFVADLRYAIDDVLMPQTINTRGIVLMSSTPAKTPGHPFFKYCMDAEKDGRLIKRTIYDNPRLTLEDLKPLIKAARGEKSTTWRREYLVEDVVDSQTAVLPNATTPKLLQMMFYPHDVSRSASAQHYVSVSVGFALKTTGLLFGSVEKVDGKDVLYIHREEEIRGMDTSQLATAVSDGEKALWEGKEPFRRVANFTPTLLGQVQKEHAIKFTPPVPVELVEAVNTARLRFEGNDIRINRDCEGLLRQVQNAVWTTNMKDFEYSDEDDDYALVKSLVQLVRNAKMGSGSTGATQGMRKLLSGRH